MCRRVRTWQGCFQPCVYDDGGEELSAETLTQPGTSGVGAGWGRRGAQRGTEGWRRRRGGVGGMRAGTGRASQQEGPGEGNTHVSQAGPRPPAHPPRPRVQASLRRPRVLSTSRTLTPLPGPREVVGGIQKEATGSKSASLPSPRGSRRGPLSQNPRSGWQGPWWAGGSGLLSLRVHKWGSGARQPRGPFGLACPRLLPHPTCTGTQRRQGAPAQVP